MQSIEDSFFDDEKANKDIKYEVKEMSLTTSWI